MSFGALPLCLTSGATALDSILSLMWVLLCVLAVLVLAYLFTKYGVGRGVFSGAGGGTDRFKALARLPLGREQSLILVQAGERYFLLGAASGGVRLVAELSQEEAQALCPPVPGPGAQPPSFSEALRTVLRQKKPR